MIEVDNLSVRAGACRLSGLSFRVGPGEYAVLMGKTGSGKTTILEALCGLRGVESGSVYLSGVEVTGRRPGERDIGYVPQDLALFQSMSVREHLAFALVLRKWGRRAIRRRVDELAGWLGLGKLLERRPRGLSGGEAQRVALGRALSFQPRTLLLDEPLGALDDETREEMYLLLRSLPAQTGVTALHVTHSTQEARRLADRVLVLRDGVVSPLPVGEWEQGNGFPGLEPAAGTGALARDKERA